MMRDCRFPSVQCRPAGEGEIDISLLTDRNHSQPDWILQRRGSRIRWKSCWIQVPIFDRAGSNNRVSIRPCVSHCLATPKLRRESDSLWVLVLWRIWDLVPRMPNNDENRSLPYPFLPTYLVLPRRPDTPPSSYCCSCRSGSLERRTRRGNRTIFESLWIRRESQWPVRLASKISAQSHRYVAKSRIKYAQVQHSFHTQFVPWLFDKLSNN